MSSCLYGPGYEILVNITYAQKPQINAYVDISVGSKGLDLGLRFHLYPYFVFASSDGSEESAHMHLPSLVDRVIRNTVCYSVLDHFIHENTNRLGVNHIALKTNAMQLIVLP